MPMSWYTEVCAAPDEAGRALAVIHSALHLHAEMATFAEAGMAGSDSA